MGGSTAPESWWDDKPADQQPGARPCDVPGIPGPPEGLPEGDAGRDEEFSFDEEDD